MRDSPPPETELLEPNMQQDATGTYVAQNEEKVYELPDWSDPNAHEYVEVVES